MTMTVALVILLVILSFIDISAVISGYFPSESYYYFYWMNDLNSGVIPLFKEDLSIFFNREIETLRNLILTMVLFAASLTLSSLIGLGHFMKRRFVASQLPLGLWKVSTLLLVLRAIIASFVSHKFHYTLLKSILIELEGIEDKENYIFSVSELYGNGTIGLIPAGVFASIALNLIVIFLSMSLIIKTEEWRRLNIKRRVY